MEESIKINDWVIKYLIEHYYTDIIIELSKEAYLFKVSLINERMIPILKRRKKPMAMVPFFSESIDSLEKEVAKGDLIEIYLVTSKKCYVLFFDQKITMLIGRYEPFNLTKSKIVNLNDYYEKKGLSKLTFLEKNKIDNLRD